MRTRTPPRLWTKRVKSLIRRPLLPLYALQGDYDGSELTALVVDDGSTLAYIRDLLFDGCCAISKKTSISLVAASRLTCSGADIVVVGANQCLAGLYRSRGFHLVPKLIRLYLPTIDHPDDIVLDLRDNGRKDIWRNVRKMKSDGYAYELARDPKWFDHFFHEMHVPFALQRYGSMAAVERYARLKQEYSRGAGLVVKKAGQTVGGTIIYGCGKTLVNSCIGIPDGDLSVAKAGSSLALYYYVMLHAHLSGYAGVDFGHSRSFLSDTALSYKLRWGMTPLNVDDSIGVFAITAPQRTEQAVKFLSTNRFFEINDEGIGLCNDY